MLVGGQDELHPSVMRHMRMMRRGARLCTVISEEFWHVLAGGMLSNDLELAMHDLEFRQTGAMCNVEEVGQNLASASPC